MALKWDFGDRQAGSCMGLCMGWCMAWLNYLDFFNTSWIDVGLGHWGKPGLSGEERFGVVS